MPSLHRWMQTLDALSHTKLFWIFTRKESRIPIGRRLTDIRHYGDMAGWDYLVKSTWNARYSCFCSWFCDEKDNDRMLTKVACLKFPMYVKGVPRNSAAVAGCWLLMWHATTASTSTYTLNLLGLILAGKIIRDPALKRVRIKAVNIEGNGFISFHLKS